MAFDFMVGGRDVLDSRLVAERLAADLPNSQHHIIEQFGHAPNMEDPSEFNRRVLGFLDQLHADG